MKHLTQIFALFGFLTLSCDEAGTPPNCSGNFVCTENYAIVGVNIKNSSGADITLDSASVTNKKTGGSRTPSFPGSPGFASFYDIASDGDMDVVDFEGTIFLLEGWIDSEKVVSEEFLIGRDCCHISKLEGPEEIILD